MIRFVVEPAPEQVEPQPSYRGAIRHIQTDEELTFCRWLGFGSAFILAKALTYAIGMLNSFFWNRSWTFSDNGNI